MRHLTKQLGASRQVPNAGNGRLCSVCSHVLSTYVEMALRPAQRGHVHPGPCSHLIHVESLEDIDSPGQNARVNPPSGKAAQEDREVLVVPRRTGTDDGVSYRKTTTEGTAH